MPTPDKAVFSEIYRSPSNFLPESGSAYISVPGAIEERSMHLDRWMARATDVKFAAINDDGRRFECSTTVDSITRQILLRSQQSLSEFWSIFGDRPIYLDITGIRHHIWAALISSASAIGRQLRVVYVEPEGYRASLTPTENEIFDLSEKIEGIAPLPRFSRLQESGSNWCFVPLMGFEGARVLHLMAHLEPPADKVIPIVGTPGFRLEYPFVTYHSNRAALLQSMCWRNARFATANCPFDMYYTLQDILRTYSGHVLKIGLVGTKPHALGGVLFGIANPNDVELIYDHPIRKAKRTAGVGRLLVYHISALLG